MKVPEFERQVGPGGLPSVRQNISVDANNFLGGTNRALLESTTGAVSSINDAAIKLQAHFEREANQSRLVDFAAQLQQHDIDAQTGANGGIGWGQLKGGQALAQPLEQNVMDGRSAFANQLIDTMGNEEQRQLAKQHLQETGQSVYGRIASHVTQQHQKYAESSLTAAIATAQQALSTNYNDPEEFKKNLTYIDGYTQELGRITHGSAELGKVQAMGHVSDAIQGAALAALQHGDYATAQMITKRYGQHLLPNDLTNLQAKIGDSYAANLSQSDPQTLFDMTKSEPIEHAIRTQESGGRDFGEDGKPLVSSDGKSMFAMQVTHDTANNPGFGIAPAKEQTPEEYNRIGRELIGKYRDKYQGDPVKIAAAYNAGASAVDEAIAQGGDNWQQFIPASTRETYIPKVLGYMKTGTPLDNMSAPDRMKWNIRARADMERGRSIFAANLKNSIDDQFVQTANTGITGTVLPEEAFQQAFGDQGPTAYADYQDRLAFNQQYFAVKDLPNDQAQALLEAAKPKAGSAEFEREQKQYDLLSKALSYADKERKDDPLAWASQNGFEVAPINWEKPREAQQAFIRRGTIAQQLKERYGTPFTVLTKDETKQISQHLSAGSEDDKLLILKTLADGINDPQGYAATLQQTRPDSPATMVAGSLIGMDRIQKTNGLFSDSVMPVHGEDVARTIIKGEAILNPSKAQREQDGKSTGVTMPGKLNESIYNLLGDALAGDLETEQGVVSAVRAYYAARMDKSKSEGGLVQDDLLSEAVQSVTGGIAEHADKKVIMPFGMNETDFLDQAEAKLKQQLGDKAAFVTFGNMPLIPVSANRYALQNGTSMLSVGGQPVILDFNR
jgi:hypothetical protein